MRPERRRKSGMDGGLTAASLVSPLLHLRMDDFLSKRWGPPHTYVFRYNLLPMRPVRTIELVARPEGLEPPAYWFEVRRGGVHCFHRCILSKRYRGGSGET